MKTSQLETRESSAQTPALAPPNPYYITGLCEGGASFTYLRNGNSLNLRFGLKLPEVDKNIIFALQGFFGAGSVYKTGTSWYYCTTSIADNHKIVTHFDQYPLIGNKMSCYKIWRQMLELKKTPRKTDMAGLRSLAEQLSTLTTKGRRYIKNHE